MIGLKNLANISSDLFEISSILNGCYDFVKSNRIQTAKKKPCISFLFSNATVMFFIIVVLGNTRNPRTASKKFSKNSAKRQRESSTFYRYTNIPLIPTVPGSHQVSSDMSVNMIQNRSGHLFNLLAASKTTCFETLLSIPLLTVAVLNCFGEFYLSEIRNYKSYNSCILRWFLSTALRIPTAHDFCVISARKLARARTQQKKFPSS